MSNPNFAKKVYKLQNAIIRELNNGHIFLEQLQPLLEDAKAQYAESSSNKDRRYYVPSTRPGKFAKRTDKELKDIYEQYQTTGLFEAFLVNAVARFEWFLADVLSEYLSHYPNRLTESVQGVPTCGKVEVATLIAAKDKSELVRKVIADHASNVFRQKPSIYMGYVAHLVGLESDPSFLDYYEISATRDLIVHNSRKINEIYMAKAGSKARGTIGGQVAVDSEYFADCVANLKRVSGAVKRDIEKKYGASSEQV